MIAWYWLVPVFFVGGIALFLPILWLLSWGIKDMPYAEGELKAHIGKQQTTNHN